ncbi:hypothetical protein C7212DRAFT_317667 [Tuber magnatum]|uniref:Uncharacterized protein n=1 Tax=Tuber magnatum TaxID=42249 RepID=A0A317SPM7_9PEZI|nr:hypothetical protein C7212DRAFT_317667 [Tuber magnatum]
MLNLEWLKSVDAELGRLLAECRGMMKSEDTATVGSFNNILLQSTTQGAGTGASPSQGLSSAESMDTLTKFMDTIEQWGMEGGIGQANNQGQVTISDAESP